MDRAPSRSSTPSRPSTPTSTPSFSARWTTIDLTASPETAPLETVEIQATQTSMHVGELALAWVPVRRDGDGRLARA